MKIYLATKYTDKDPTKMEMSCIRISYVAAELMKMGHIVFSPITHSHPLALILNNQTDLNFWMPQSLSFIDWADALVVFELEKCKKSYGVQQEIECAKKKNLLIYDAKWADHYIKLDYWEDNNGTS